MVEAHWIVKKHFSFLLGVTELGDSCSYNCLLSDSLFALPFFGRSYARQDMNLTGGSDKVYSHNFEKASIIKSPESSSQLWTLLPSSLWLTAPMKGQGLVVLAAAAEVPQVEFLLQSLQPRCNIYLVSVRTAHKSLSSAQEFFSLLGCGFRKLPAHFGKLKARFFGDWQKAKLCKQTNFIFGASTFPNYLKKRKEGRIKMNTEGL